MSFDASLPLPPQQSTGLCSQFEKKLKELNPNVPQLSYEIQDIYNYIDSMVRIIHGKRRLTYLFVLQHLGTVLTLLMCSFPSLPSALLPFLAIRRTWWRSSFTPARPPTSPTTASTSRSRSSSTSGNRWRGERVEGGGRTVLAMAQLELTTKVQLELDVTIHRHDHSCSARPCVNLSLD